MTDYTPAKPIEAGCMAMVIPHDKCEAPGFEYQKGIVGAQYFSDDLVNDRRFFRMTDIHPYLICSERALMRIDDPGEEVSESTRESIPADAV